MTSFPFRSTFRFRGTVTYRTLTKANKNNRADGPHSVILNQVTYGIAIRMAVLSMAMSGQTAQRQFEQENAQ